MQRHFLRAALLSVACLAVTATGTSAATATFQVPAGIPRVLSIPEIGVKAPVESINLTQRTQIDAPHRFGDVAWFNQGPKPGAQGHATMFGHVDSTCCPAIFYHLRDLRAGNTFQVQYDAKHTLTFRVMWTATYPTNKMPMSFLFGPSTNRALILMTCAGLFHRDGTGYDHRLVVYGRLVLPGGKLG